MEAAIIPGAIYRGAIIRGQFVGGQFSGGQFFGHVNLMITPSSGCFIAEIKQSHKPTSLTGSNTCLKGEKIPIINFYRKINLAGYMIGIFNS